MSKNRKPTSADHWFLCIAEFTCPECDGNSKEIIPLAVEKPDPAAINKILSQQNLFCQLCKKPVVQGTSVSLSVEPTTLEAIRTSGLKLPEVFDSPGYLN
jgi:hypothetical protein